MSIQILQAKLNRVQGAISRVKELVEKHEDEFIEVVGIQELHAKKKAKGYHEYILEDKVRLSMLEQIESRLRSYIKQHEQEAAKELKAIAK